MPTCWIGIGANLGDARAAFDAAWRQLEDHPSITLLNRSGLYRTAAVGQNSGGPYTNAAFSLDIAIEPLELLDVLQAIETDLGRTRDVRWGPRPIDLDLLLIDQQVLTVPRLTIPHPAAWYRRFVLDPLVEIAPNLVHPQLGSTLTQIHGRLTTRPFVVGFFEPILPILLKSICDRFADVQFLPAESDAAIPTVCLQLQSDDPAGNWCGAPIADLRTVPGDVPQRVTDFLTAALDAPVRTGDW